MNRHCTTAARAGAAPIKRQSKAGTRKFNGVGPFLFYSQFRGTGATPGLRISPRAQCYRYCAAAIAKISRPRHDRLLTIREPNLPSKTIEEPARQVPLYGEYEVV